MQIVRVNVIVRGEVIPYMLGSPKLVMKKYHILGYGSSHTKVGWFLELGKFSQSKLK